MSAARLPLFPIRGGRTDSERYFRPDGTADTHDFSAHPLWHADSDRVAADELAVAGNFVEVYLAKENHDGVVGINFLEKSAVANPPAIYGAMLAGVDYILMGAESLSRYPVS